jgi:hypothetical protein
MNLIFLYFLTAFVLNNCHVFAHTDMTLSGKVSAGIPWQLQYQLMTLTFVGDRSRGRCPGGCRTPRGGSGQLCV